MRNKTKTNSGFTMIILLISVLIVALLSLYVMNKLYSKQAAEVGKQNGIDYQAPNIQNAQNQVDAAREKIKNIQDQENSQVQNMMNQK